LDEDLTDLTDNSDANATPNSTAMPNADRSEPGVAFGRGMVDRTEDHIAECLAPTGTVGFGVGGGDRFEF
jgi:hypothetical protein